MKKYFVLLFCVAVTSIFAAKPVDSIVIEAENLKLSGSWKVRNHFPGWYAGKPSCGKMLNGFSKRPGSASGSFTIAKPGRYRLWVRYLDVLKAPASFIVSIVKDGEVTGEYEFNKVPRKHNPAIFEGDKAVNEESGKVRFRWDAMEFNAPFAGNYKLELRKGSVNRGTIVGSLHLDCFLITSDLKFKATIGDLYPVLIKFRLLKDAEKPFILHFFGKRGHRPTYMKHINIGKIMIAKGIGSGFGKRANYLSKAGDETPWFDVSPLLGYGGFNVLEFTATDSYSKNTVENAEFEVLVSRNADGKDIVKRFTRTGKGKYFNLAINLEQNIIIDDLAGSTQSLSYAKATSGGGKRPMLFPMITRNSVIPSMHQQATVDNEFETMRLIGINGISSGKYDDFPQYRAVQFFNSFRFKGCPGRPDKEKMDRILKKEALAVKDKAFVLLGADEPGFDINHVVKCKSCAEDFPEFLKKYAPGVSGGLTTDPKQPELFYWSRRFRSHLGTKLFETGKDIVGKYAPKLPVTVNFGLSIMSGNMMRSGCDWFEIMRTNALTYGWHEDWANHSNNYQINGFQTDVMRAACRPNGQNFAMYNIIRTPWEIEAKTFLHIAHGCKAISFFNYGPHYMMSTDSRSYRKEIFQAIRNSTMAVGPHEKTIMASRCAKGDAAMLFSLTSDIWNEITDSVYGRERVYLSLLLRHCGIRTDILNEDDLAAELKNYKTLFAVDSHLRRSQLKYITDWVKSGGILYLGAGALRFDEYNKALKFPVKREAYRQLGKAGSAQYFLPKLKVAEVFREMPVIAGMQKPFYRETALGKGKIIYCGFFPGLSYQYSAKKTPDTPYSIWDYPEAHRNFIKALPLGITPRIKTDNYRVEAGLLEAGNEKLIVLSNWSGKPATVTVTVDGKKRQFTIGAGGIFK